MEESFRGCTDHDRVRFSDLLQMSGEVGRLSQRKLLVLSATSYLTDHDPARVNPEAHGEADVMVPREP
jgi:hypothetical protein